MGLVAKPPVGKQLHSALRKPDRGPGADQAIRLPARRRAQRILIPTETTMGESDPVFQRIFDHAAVGIAQIALDGAFLRVNDWYCQMLGYSRTELLTKNVHDISPPEHMAEVRGAC